MTPSALTAGFADPVTDAQAAFRAMLDAMACPGRVRTLPALAEPPPAPLIPALAAVALCLCDADTMVWLDAPLAAGAVAGWLRFHCGCPIVPEPAAARFAFAACHPPQLSALDAGCDLYPDRSATLVLRVADLAQGQVLRLRGPGLRDGATVRVAGLPDDFVAQRAADHRRYPRGIDCILAAGDQVLCLPRSTIVEPG